MVAVDCSVEVVPAADAVLWSAGAALEVCELQLSEIIWTSLTAKLEAAVAPVEEAVASAELFSGMPLISTMWPTCSFSLASSPDSLMVWPLSEARVKLPSEPLRQPRSDWSLLWVLVCEPAALADGSCAKPSAATSSRIAVIVSVFFIV